MVVAGAGSGKTNVITHKIAYLLQAGNYLPGQVLGLTFTNRAAAEMKDRIFRLTGIPHTSFQISTFHSLGLKILRERGDRFGFDPRWQVIDEQDQRQILSGIIKESCPHYTNDMAEAARRRINLAKMNLVYPNDAESLRAMGFDDSEVHIFSLYHGCQGQRCVWDFEDLVSYAVKLLHRNADIQGEYSDRFRYVVVDEFQDTNPNQYELIKTLTQRRSKITVVGDDDQAIYSWRGASVRFLLDFERDFPGTRVIKLEQNYRSTMPILDFANHLIATNTLRRPKKMWTDRGSGQPVCLLRSLSKEDEATKVVDLIALLKRDRPDMFPVAILYRINSQSLAFETELLKRDIPFRIVKGLRFFDRKEVKDCLALLKLALNPNDDISFARVVGFLPMGIGEKSMEELAGYSRGKRISLFNAMATLYPKKLSTKPLFSSLAAMPDGHVERVGYHKLLNELLSISGYRDILQNKEDQSRWLNVAELLEFDGNWEEEFPQAAFVDLLDRISLESPGQRVREDMPVDMLTMHNAKGTEYPTVVVVGINATYMPFFLRKGVEEWEEERRLFYVASTRAQNQLIVSVGSDRPSRFLTAIDHRHYRVFYDSHELYNHLATSEKASQSGPEPNGGGIRYVQHLLCGRGRIITPINQDTFLIEFEGRGQKVIDGTRVELSFLG